MTQNAEEDIDSSELIRVTSFNQISSSVESSYRINYSEGSKSFPGGLITVKRTICQVQEEIAVMEVHSKKPSKSAVSKASKLGGRLLKTLFDSSPAEVVFTESQKPKEAKERELKEANAKSASSKSSSSSGSGGKPYTIASVSPPHRKPAVPIEFGGYEEPLCSPLYPVVRKGQQRQINHNDPHDSFITPGIRAYPKPRETPPKYSKYAIEKDSPGRGSSRTTSTEASSLSNAMESDFEHDSTGDRISRREKERHQQALIDRLHAEALKMKLVKAEEEMQKLRMEVHSQADPQKPTQLDVYRSESNSHSSHDGDRRGVSRINSMDDGTNCGGQQHEYSNSCPTQSRPDIAPLRSTLFVADGEDGRKAQQREEDSSDRDIGANHWVDYQPELEILDDPPMQVDNAWRSAQMYTFLQDAAAVNTVSAVSNILSKEKKIAFTVQKREQQSRAHSRSQSSVESPTHLNHEKVLLQQQQQQRLAQTRHQSRSDESLSSHQIQHQDSRYVQSRPHSRSGDSPTEMQQQVHSVERSRSVETMSTTTQQQRHVIQRTKSVESNTSNISSPSPKGAGSPFTSRTRNTTIAERISRTHNVVNVQQSTSVSPPQSELHRSQQSQQVSNSQPEHYRQQSPRRSQQEVGYQHQQQQQSVSQQQYSDYHRQPQSMPQPPHQEYRQQHQQQSHQQQQQLEFDVHRQPQADQYREQETITLQPEQHRHVQKPQPSQSAPQQPEHHGSKSLTFPILPQLILDLKPSSDVDDASSSPLQLSPTSAGLITPTGMPPPTAFQSEAERAAYQHQKTMEKLYNARRNREAILLNNRSRPVTGGYS